MKRRSLTDWPRLKKVTEEEIERQALADADAQPTNEIFWKEAEVKIPPKRVSVRLDAEVLAWFKAQGKDYRNRINDVLKAYINAHR